MYMVLPVAPPRSVPNHYLPRLLQFISRQATTKRAAIINSIIWKQYMHLHKAFTRKSFE